MKKNTKLYNMILPPYLLMVFSPVLLLIAMVGNFIIDSVVMLIISLLVFKRINIKFYTSRIFLIWIFGFAGDFAGLIMLLIGSEIGWSYINSHPDGGTLYQIMDGMNNVTNHSADLNFYSYLFIVAAIITAAGVIFVLDNFVAFQKSGLTKKQRALSALAFAVFTAPYTFLLPNSLFYGN